MPTPLALVLAAALAAGDGASPAAGAAPGAFVLSLSAGPSWLGGRAGVGGLALDDVAGGGAFLGAEALARATPALAYGVVVEGTADAPAGGSAPPCREGAGRGCDAAYTRFGAVGRWSFQRAPFREAWASVGTGVERLRIASFGPARLRLDVHGWEIATLAVGVDWPATRRLGVGVFASGSFGTFTRVVGGEATESVRAPHYALRAGIRGVVRAGEGRLAQGRPPLPPVSAPKGSALSVEGRLGGATCGFCGLLLGVSVAGRAGPVVAGGFAEAAVVPFESFPSKTAPKEERVATFVGGFAGAAARVGRRARVEVLAEMGVERSGVSLEYYDGTERADSAAVAFAGGRAKIELPFARDEGALGISVFVREPLRTACVDVGEGCEKLGATAGVVLHGSIALWRRGTAPAVAPPEPPP